MRNSLILIAILAMVAPALAERRFYLTKATEKKEFSVHGKPISMRRPLIPNGYSWTCTMDVKKRKGQPGMYLAANWCLVHLEAEDHAIPELTMQPVSYDHELDQPVDSVRLAAVKQFLKANSVSPLFLKNVLSYRDLVNQLGKKLDPNYKER